MIPSINNKGQSLTEFALILPIFIFFFIGCISIGSLLTAKAKSETVARCAAMMRVGGGRSVDSINSNSLIHQILYRRYYKTDSNSSNQLNINYGTLAKQRNNREGVDNYLVDLLAKLGGARKSYIKYGINTPTMFMGITEVDGEYVVMGDTLSGGNIKNLIFGVSGKQ